MPSIARPRPEMGRTRAMDPALLDAYLDGPGLGGSVGWGSIGSLGGGSRGGSRSGSRNSARPRTYDPTTSWDGLSVGPRVRGFRGSRRLAGRRTVDLRWFQR